MKEHLGSASSDQRTEQYTAAVARERPILFSGPMVRAILAGTSGRTVTWRPHGMTFTKRQISDLDELIAAAEQYMREEEQSLFYENRDMYTAEDRRACRARVRAVVRARDLLHTIMRGD